MNYGEEPMPTSNSNSRLLHPIEEAIISHVRRYGLTTPAASVAAGIRGMTSVDIAQNRLDALVRRGDLRHEPLTRSALCYVSSRVVASRLGQESVSEYQRPLSIQEKLRRYAMLQFCSMGDAKRSKLTAEEMSERFSEMYRDGQPLNYYVDNTGTTPRLGFLRVDVCGRGRWDRIVAKVSDDLRRHLQFPLVRKLLNEDAFEVTVVTALSTKAKGIESALSEKKDVLPVPIRCVAMPEFVNIIRPPPD